MACSLHTKIRAHWCPHHSVDLPKHSWHFGYSSHPANKHLWHTGAPYDTPSNYPPLQCLTSALKNYTLHSQTFVWGGGGLVGGWVERKISHTSERQLWPRVKLSRLSWLQKGALLLIALKVPHFPALNITSRWISTDRAQCLFQGWHGGWIILSPHC